jgi:hypothetical protein
MSEVRLKRVSLQDAIVRYDLREMREEVRLDFNPETGSQRLLKQSEISARFRKRPKIGPRAS